MPNIAAVLKQEISRLARKEIRRQTNALRKASAAYSTIMFCNCLAHPQIWVRLQARSRRRIGQQVR
jgi:hypothetical protein